MHGVTAQNQMEATDKRPLGGKPRGFIAAAWPKLLVLNHLVGNTAGEIKRSYTLPFRDHSRVTGEPSPNATTSAS